MHNPWKPRLVLAGAGLALITALCACSQPRTPLNAILPIPAEAELVGSDSCCECHEAPGDQFKHNVHSLLADFEYEANGIEARGCEACHGPASRHVETGNPGCILQFGKLDALQSSAICQSCHTAGDTMEWRHSIHAGQGLSCTDCHSIHSNTKGLLSKPQEELCLSCHQNVKAQLHLPNHHPVTEGKMGCNDCHNPHGSQTRPLLRTDERKSELCLTCHMDQAGPFAFEHAPVTEDCTICHSPHGSVADNLLKQNEPFLCLQCHELHFHTNFRPDMNKLAQYAADGVAGAQSTLNTINNNGIDDKHAMQMAMMTRCSQCHPSVHGSDLPSLYTPGGGSRLTR
ncbi:MAG: GSU2203 family decaheme c-type cytochrome [Desulfuromonas thiophila]|nr:GSU2203 family decaheme c-type cytochrome [Desulfuromonas thiophila]MDY0398974.1 GSU2203 family decaheme c-type cytochrome [Desulfuromonas thiophila]